MQMIVKTRPEAAAAVRRKAGGERAAAIESLSGPPGALQQTLRTLGIQLQPLHPNIDDPQLSTYFTAEVDDTAAERVMAALNAEPAVEGAYPAAKPEPA